MENKLTKFQKLYELFDKNGYSFYLVGGTVRDYFLHKELTDMDAVTDATPEEMKNIIPDANFQFAKFGSVRYKFKDVKFDITTLRKEESYLDSRHPTKITFVKDLNEDVKRRDFTINGMYLSHDLKVIDLVGGQDDLKQGIIRMIGNPENRLKEDPLRIIRAIRFSLDFDFVIEDSLDKAIRNNIDLLNRLNIDKVREDIKKITCQDKEKIITKFSLYNIKHLLGVIE